MTLLADKKNSNIIAQILSCRDATNRISTNNLLTIGKFAVPFHPPVLATQKQNDSPH
jgi:hypothetical protein